MKKIKEIFKSIYITTTNLMHKYIIAHFYVGAIAFAITIAEKCNYTDIIQQSFAVEEFPFSIIVVLFAVMFIPALIWFILTKYIKNIKRYVTVIFFVLFLLGEMFLFFIMLLVWGWRI